jgi:hypothetical protein
MHAETVLLLKRRFPYFCAMSILHISVNDELQELKQVARQYNKTIVKIEKVGNGNMSAFKIWYQNSGDDTVLETFFWRHDMEKLISLFKQEREAHG